MAKQVVLGIGNLLLADEGVGVHIARALQKSDLPAGTEVLEVGTAILDALPALESADRLFIIDAMHGGQLPGTVYRVDLRHCRNNPSIASMHGFDILRAISLTRRDDLPEGVVFGIEPEHIGWSLDLSPAVSESVPVVCEHLKNELEIIR